MAATPDPATPGADDAFAAAACERARELAHRGDLAGAASEFQRVLACTDTRLRGEAAFGLGAVREAHGDVEEAREACLLALRTGDPEYAPRAGYNLALSYERGGEWAEARDTWQSVVAAGNARYLPGALCRLAEIVADEGDTDTAEGLWERAVESGDREYAPLAAYNLGAQLFQRGQHAAALQAFTTASIDDPAGHARANLGVTHLELAIAAFQGALARADTETLPLATELLGRTLPLRGAYEEAQQVWEYGLGHDEPEVAAGVRDRLRRELDGPAGGRWDELIEDAVRTHTLPRLTGELFAAIEQMYEGAGDADAVRSVPHAYGWGARLTGYGNVPQPPLG